MGVESWVECRRSLASSSIVFSLGLSFFTKHERKTLKKPRRLRRLVFCVLYFQSAASIQWSLGRRYFLGNLEIVLIFYLLVPGLQTPSLIALKSEENPGVTK